MGKSVHDNVTHTSATCELVCRTSCFVVLSIEVQWSLSVTIGLNKVNSSVFQKNVEFRKSEPISQVYFLKREDSLMCAEISTHGGHGSASRNVRVFKGVSNVHLPNFAVSSAGGGARNPEVSRLTDCQPAL